MASTLDMVNAYSGFSKGVNIPTGGVAGFSAGNVARDQEETSKFQALIDSINSEALAAKAEKTNPGLSTLSTSQIAQSSRLTGDYTTGMANAFTSESDKAALPSGAAANAKGAHGKSADKKIDKTSKLYEQALELESYFVKIMLSSMRNTVSKTNLFGENNSYARDTYEDMLYDELAGSITKAAGFGLADQIYLDLMG